MLQAGDRVRRRVEPQTDPGRLEVALRAARNADGGWGYYRGKASRLEPTCWALLALRRGSRSAPDSSVLDKWVRQGPWRTDVQGAPVNYAFQALAGLTLLHAQATSADAADIGAALLDVRGVRFDQTPAIRQDNSLQAWPWIENTFSWVEPTAMALLLIKKLRGRLNDTALTDRVLTAERVLADRSCTGGGWNYGGSNVYGQELFPYVPTTAWGLLALQDRPANAVVTAAIKRLRDEVTTEPSAVALALAVIALRTFRQPAEKATALLTDLVPRVLDTSHVVALAMSLYVLANPADSDRAFRL